MSNDEKITGKTLILTVVLLAFAAGWIVGDGSIFRLGDDYSRVYYAEQLIEDPGLFYANLPKMIEQRDMSLQEVINMYFRYNYVSKSILQREINKMCDVEDTFIEYNYSDNSIDLFCDEICEGEI